MEQWKDLPLNSRFSGKRRGALDTLITSTKEISIVFDNFPFFKQLLFSKYDDVRSATIWLLESLLTKELVDQLTQDEKQQLGYLSERIFSEESLFSPSRETKHLLKKSGKLVQKQYKDPLNDLLNYLIQILRNMDKAIFLQSLNILTWLVLYSSPQVDLSILQEILIAEITKKNEKTIAYSVILAGTLGNQSMVDFLIKFHQQEKITDHGNKTVCLALGKSKHPQVEEYFFSIVDNKEKPALIYPILLGLSHFSDEDVSNLFFELLKSFKIEDAFAHEAFLEPGTSLGQWTFFVEQDQIFGMSVSGSDTQYAMEQERKYAKEKYDDASATSVPWLLLTIETLGKRKHKAAIPKLLEIAFYKKYPLDAKKLSVLALQEIDEEWAYSGMLAFLLGSEPSPNAYMSARGIQSFVKKYGSFKSFIEAKFKSISEFSKTISDCSSVILDLLKEKYSFTHYFSGNTLGYWSDLDNSNKPETKRAMTSNEFETLLENYKLVKNDIYKSLILSSLAIGTNTEESNAQIYEFLIKCYQEAVSDQLKVNVLSALCAFLRINRSTTFEIKKIELIIKDLGNYPNLYLNKYILSIIRKYRDYFSDSLNIPNLVSNSLPSLGTLPNKSEIEVQRIILRILDSYSILDLYNSDDFIDFIFKQIREETIGWIKPEKFQNSSVTELILPFLQHQSQKSNPIINKKIVEIYKHVFVNGIFSYWHSETCGACKSRKWAIETGQHENTAHYGTHIDNHVFNKKLIDLYLDFIKFLTVEEKKPLYSIIPIIKSILKPETQEEIDQQKKVDMFNMKDYLISLLDLLN